MLVGTKYYVVLLIIVLLPYSAFAAYRLNLSYLKLEQLPLFISNQFETSFREVKRERDRFGRVHMRLQQYHQGVPVFGGEVVLHEQRSNESDPWALSISGM